MKSGVLRLVRRDDPIDCDYGVFKHIVKTAFNQRRKMLRKSLKPLFDPKTLTQEILFSTQRKIKQFTYLMDTRSYLNKTIFLLKDKKIILIR